MLYSSRKTSKQKLEKKQNSLLQLNSAYFEHILNQTVVNGGLVLFVIYSNLYDRVQTEIPKCLLKLFTFLGPEIQFLSSNIMIFLKVLLILSAFLLLFFAPLLHPHSHRFWNALGEKALPNVMLTFGMGFPSFQDFWLYNSWWVDSIWWIQIDVSYILFNSVRLFHEVSSSKTNLFKISGSIILIEWFLK